MNDHIDQIHLSLCMIVRDSERTLRPCLQSIAPWVDEMVIVDTGSQDRTLEIVQSFKAKIYHFPWIDDFSAARNESLGHATGRWIFWMDSDDTISRENGARLRQLAMQQHPESLLGFVMQVHCPAGSQKDVTVVDHVKLVRNLRDLRFEGRIHEQLLPAIRRLNGQVAWTDIAVVHSGSDHSTTGRRRKLERDLRILEMDLQERPDHPFVMFNFGMTYNDAQDHIRAVRWLQRSLAFSLPHESHVRKAYAMLIHSLTALGRHGEASSTASQALRLFPDDAELWFREGILAQNSGDGGRAVAAYRHALAGESERRFMSRDPGICGVKARHNLALAYTSTGQLEAAEFQWRLVLQADRSNREGWRGLRQSLFAQKKLTAARLEAANLRSVAGLEAEYVCWEAELCILHRDWDGALRFLITQEASCQVDNDSRELLCRVYFEKGDFQSAIPILDQHVANDPCDAATLHNLGVAYTKVGKRLEAIPLLEASLQFRPGYQLTIDALREARQGLEVSSSLQ